MSFHGKNACKQNDSKIREWWRFFSISWTFGLESFTFWYNLLCFNLKYDVDECTSKLELSLGQPAAGSRSNRNVSKFKLWQFNLTTLFFSFMDVFIDSKELSLIHRWSSNKLESFTYALFWFKSKLQMWRSWSLASFSELITGLCHLSNSFIIVFILKNQRRQAK